MIYSREVEEMCPVAQGVHHGAAPIPEEANHRAGTHRFQLNRLYYS